MNESSPNGPVPPKEVDQVGEDGNTITVSFDRFVEFIENGSQPASAWPWPEPPFVRDPKSAPPKS